jgi:hypothetical protein
VLRCATIFRACTVTKFSTRTKYQNGLYLAYYSCTCGLPRLLSTCTVEYCSIVHLATRKSRTLGILAFDEKSTFDFFASNGKIKRACCSGNSQTLNYETRARVPRIENFFRKHTETARARRALEDSESGTALYSWATHAHAAGFCLLYVTKDSLKTVPLDAVSHRWPSWSGCHLYPT